MNRKLLIKKQIIAAVCVCVCVNESLKKPFEIPNGLVEIHTHWKKIIGLQTDK
jgi:acyl-CoA thioesterase FadM